MPVCSSFVLSIPRNEDIYSELTWLEVFDLGSVFWLPEQNSSSSGPAVQSVSAVRLEREVVGSIPGDQRLFTPPAHVRRQPLPVWPPTFNKIP